MTVTNTTPIITYSYTGAGDYTFPFEVFEETDLILYHVSTLGVVTTLVLTTDYTITLVDGVDGGTCHLTFTGTTGTLKITRHLPRTQDTNWLNNDAFNVEQIETDLDRLVLLVQELEYKIADTTAYAVWKGIWVTDYPYVLRDMVVSMAGDLYICVVGHTSGVFATDFYSGYWEVMMDVPGAPAMGDELTIASGVITITHNKDGRYSVDTEADAASDDLDSIAGTVAEGTIIVLYPADSARTVVVVHSVNIALNAGIDFTMNHALDNIMLMSRGGGVYSEISRSSNGD